MREDDPANHIPPTLAHQSSASDPSKQVANTAPASDSSISESQITSMRLTVSLPEGESIVQPPAEVTEPHLRIDAPDDHRFDAHLISTEETTDRAADAPNRSRSNKTSPHPVTQSMTLLASMMLMLVIARFTVPRIVEEIRYSWHRGELRAEYETGAEGLRNVSLDSLSRAYQMVTSAVGPSVVHIDVRRAKLQDNELMRRIHGKDPFALADQGSGVVVDEDGYILTNRHVIADGKSIFVTLSDGRRRPAQVIGSDTLTDLAVLKIEADGLLPIQWGDSDSLRVGSPVWAVGSPFGLDRTITFGILSGKHRMVSAGQQHGASKHYQDFMQSDVAVNPGNSGGPLVDAKGTLVGINTAIVGDTYQGVSFSIPSNLSKEIYQRIRKTGRVQRGFLGVTLGDVPDEQLLSENTRIRGALVYTLSSEDAPAAKAGLMPGDLIVTANGEQITDRGHLMRMIGQAGVGAKIDLEVRREENMLHFEVELAEFPPSLLP